MTLRELIAEGETVLKAGPHPERARLDADRLFLHVAGRDRAWLLGHSDEKASARVQEDFRALIARRLMGEPVQYITGEAEFYGLPFAVAPGVLIPRPETEHLVEEVIRLAGDWAASGLNIADIGTGSGAIAVALAHALPEARVAAVDLSLEALRIAGANAERNAVTDRVEFFEGDLLGPLVGRKFHIIASNPPYVPGVDLDSLSVEVREFEPHLALFAGKDGLEIYRRLIPGARELLLPRGWLVMEIGFGQREAIDSLLAVNGYTDIRFIEDYQGIPRVALGRVD